MVEEQVKRKEEEITDLEARYDHTHNGQHRASRRSERRRLLVGGH